MSRRARLSIGPGTPILGALADSKKANRRTSLGGGEKGSEEKKDRKAMLDEWRKIRAAGTSVAVGGASSVSNNMDSNTDSLNSATAAPSLAKMAASPARMNIQSRSPSPADRAASPARHYRGISTAPDRSFEDEPTVHLTINTTNTQQIKSDEKENDGLSAYERYRLKRQLQAIGVSTGLATSTPTKRSTFDFDDDSSLAGTTPSRRSKKARKSLLAGGAQTRVRRRSMTPDRAELPPPPAAVAERKKHNMLPPSYPSSAPSSAPSSVEERAPLPPSSSFQAEVTTHFSQESTDSIDSLAMKSRISAMQKRIDMLEREKMELSMSKAPLEARMRQKEDAFIKERERLLAEIDMLHNAGRTADERVRELEMENEALGESIKRLRLQAKEAKYTSSSADNTGEQDAWNERLRNNKEIAVLRSDLKDRDGQIQSLRLDKVSLEAEVHAFKQQIESLEKNYDELERDYGELEASKSKNSEAEIQLEVLTAEMVATTAQLNATSADFEETKSRTKADMQAKEVKWKARESDLLFEISVLKSRAGKQIDDADGTMGEEDTAVLKARIEERDRRILELEEQLLNGEQLRRALHNRIQELRGNIRVYVRTRPFLPNDGASSSSSIDILPDGESLTIAGRRGENPYAFKFDKVFAPSAGQEIVFDEVSEFVQSALDGYHVCLFSYGQTGSGKTHTMQGSGNGAMRGIIPRAVEQILAQAAALQTQRWTFTMKASFLEIYNEELRDLLVMMNSDGTTRPRDATTATKLSIKRNADGKSYVDGINMVDIDVEDRANGIEQLEAVMAAAARARSVAKTNMNSQSSRSHSVFMLHLCGSNEESGTIVQGALNLCDLAGSERLDRSGAGSNAQRLKETQAINKSLSCLGDVFNALSNGSKHVPFRNSKLTYLLQDCLSGDGKALMFVNLSPTVESSSESLCSLRFAQRVNQVELGKAVKNVQYSK